MLVERDALHGVQLALLSDEPTIREGEGWRVDESYLDVVQGHPSLTGWVSTSWLAEPSLQSTRYTPHLTSLSIIARGQWGGGRTLASLASG